MRVMDAESLFADNDFGTAVPSNLAATIRASSSDISDPEDDDTDESDRDDIALAPTLTKQSVPSSATKGALDQWSLDDDDDDDALLDRTAMKNRTMGSTLTSTLTGRPGTANASSSSYTSTLQHKNNYDATNISTIPAKLNGTKLPADPNTFIKKAVVESKTGGLAVSSSSGAAKTNSSVNSGNT